MTRAEQSTRADPAQNHVVRDWQFGKSFGNYYGKLGKVDWTPADVAELIGDLRARRGDTATVEVKSAADGCPTLGPSLCAFGNMPDGGTIILGLDEGGGFAPVGLDDIATLEQGVAGQAREAVTPPVNCVFQTLPFQGDQILVCHVAGLPLASRPARHRGQAYLRQSDGDYPMSDQEIAQIEVQKTQAFRRTHPDQEAVDGTTTSELDDRLLEMFLISARQQSRRNARVTDEELLRRTGVTTQSGELTLAGLYAMGSYPQQYHPNLGVTAAVQLPRDSGARNRDLQHFDGPIPDLLDSAMEWVRRNTRATMRYDERGHGVDVSELPMTAVREIIANALVHRNLDAVTDAKRVEIRLLDDQLLVMSPGGLWGVTERQLGQPNGKSAVNLFLYEICKRVRMPDGTRVIEGEGGGIREAMLALREAGLRPPKFIDAGVRFEALISRHTLLDDSDLAWLASLPASSDLSSEQRAVLAAMHRGQPWTNGMVRDEFAPMDSVDARRLLQQLVDKGLAVMTGSRGTTIYELAPAYGGSPTEEAIHGLGPNAVTIWAALEQPASFRQLLKRLTLTQRQLRYALDRLREAQLVTLDGAPGQRDSIYRRRSGA